MTYLPLALNNNTLASKNGMRRVAISSRFKLEFQKKAVESPLQDLDEWTAREKKRKKRVVFSFSCKTFMRHFIAFNISSMSQNLVRRQELHLRSSLYHINLCSLVICGNVKPAVRRKVICSLVYLKKVFSVCQCEVAIVIDHRRLV